MMLGPLFSKVLPANQTTEIDTDVDIQLANVALEGTSAGRTVVKLHYIDYDSLAQEDDSEDEEGGEEDEEGDAKIDGSSDPSATDEPAGEDATVILCSLYPGTLEQVSLNVLLPADIPCEFIVEGPNTVHILGNQVYQPPPPIDDYPYSDSDDEMDSEIDSAEYDSGLEDDEGGLYDPETGLPVELEDDEDDDDDDFDSEDEDEVDARFSEIQDERVSPAKPLVNGHANGLVNGAAKSKADAADGGMDIDTSADLSGLSKNQRKKLAKKAKAEAAQKGDNNVQAVTGTREEKVTVSKDGKKVDDIKTTAEVTVTGGDGKDVKATTKKQSKRTTLSSGVVIEDMKTGDGAAAKAGSKVSMRYIGKLKDGTVFDSNTKGKPFVFKLGKGEVIKGWDAGIEGMRPGGERRLTIPPSQAYGKQGTDGIPPNSVLTFDVKLLSSV